MLKILSKKNVTNSSGFVEMGSENLDDDYGKQKNMEEREVDQKEAFDLFVKKMELIQWPNNFVNLDNFKNTVEITIKKMWELGKVLLRILSIALGEEEDFLLINYYKDDPVILFRLLMYPHPTIEQVDKKGHVLGCGTHSDYGFVTMLIQDDTGGLELKNLDNEWVFAKPIEGTIVVNLGDCMERITNGKFRATPHRVILTNTERDRYSVAMFCDPHLESVLSPLSSFLGDDQPKFETITYGEHLMNRYNNTYVINKSI